MSVKKLIIAAFGAIVIYAVWYYFMVGKFCLAMWAGTAPPVIMLIAFFSILSLLRNWS